METVFVRKVKRPAGNGVWSAYVVASDADGRWLYTPKGSLFRGDDGGTCEVGQGAGDAHGRHVISLISPGEWWIASWARESARYPIAIDVCTPPQLVESEWSYIDLELDPYRDAAGAVDTDDWDEFEDACAVGLISSAEATAARAAVSKIETMLREHAEPFGAKGFTLLAECVARSLPALTDLSAVPMVVDAADIAARHG